MVCYKNIRRKVYVTKSGAGVIIIPTSIVRTCHLNHENSITVKFLIFSKKYIKYVCSISKSEKQTFIIIPKPLVRVLSLDIAKFVELEVCKEGKECHIKIKPVL